MSDGASRRIRFFGATTKAEDKGDHFLLNGQKRFIVGGGIGYTNIFPIERIYRDIRLAYIWTGSSEVMNMIIAHEWYRERLQGKGAGKGRDYETDAPEAFAVDEKIYE